MRPRRRHGFAVENRLIMKARVLLCLQRLDEIWGEACGSKCPPLSQPSKSVCKIRVSFETPEARNSFCLEAYRPENGEH
jgi:hypothetical protein